MTGTPEYSTDAAKTQLALMTVEVEAARNRDVQPGPVDGSEAEPRGHFPDALPDRLTSLLQSGLPC